MTEPHEGTARSPSPEPPARRIDVARHLLQPHLLRDSLAMASQPSLRNSALAGVQAAIAAAIALPLIHLSPWSHLIGFAALGTLVALFGRFAPERRRRGIVLLCALLQTGTVFVMSWAAWLGLPTWALLALLAAGCGVLFLLTVSGRFGAPGALIFVFAAGASMDAATSFPAVIERTAATAAVAALAWLICASTEFLRHKATPESSVVAEPTEPLSDRLMASIRISAGAAMAIFASHALGAAHPAWAAMGSLAVMQGAHLHISMHRALQRMAGTVIGALVAWLVLLLDPSVWTVVAILIGLQIATEMIIGSNYGLGQILVTPMALLMTYLANPGVAGTAIVPERVIDTMLGAAIGISAAVLFSTVQDRQELARRDSLTTRR
jgi:hypothetical protein